MTWIIWIAFAIVIGLPALFAIPMWILASVAFHPVGKK